MVYMVIYLCQSVYKSQVYFLSSLGSICLDKRLLIPLLSTSNALRKLVNIYIVAIKINRVEAMTYYLTFTKTSLHMFIF